MHLVQAVTAECCQSCGNAVHQHMLFCWAICTALAWFGCRLWPPGLAGLLDDVNAARNLGCKVVQHCYAELAQALNATLPALTLPNTDIARLSELGHKTAQMPSGILDTA